MEGLSQKAGWVLSHHWVFRSHQYFHGDNSRGVGASHQTGWTGVVAELINKISKTSPSIPLLKEREAKPVL